MVLLCRMIRLIVVALLVFQAGATPAQLFTTYTGDGRPGEILTEFDQTPVYAEGVSGLFQYFENNVFAPMPARSQQETTLQEDNNTFYEQKVVLAFDLNKYGEISNRRVEYSSNMLMDRSWQHALDDMGLWAPAKIYGEPTDIQVYLPIRYIIDGNQIIVLGWGEWLYQSSGQDFWLKMILGALVLGSFALLFFNL
jgi:hypothetical protein